MLTGDEHELIEYEIACAYAAGYAAALADVAERADSLDETWKPARRRTPDEVVAERVTEMKCFDVERWMRGNTERQRRRDAVNFAARLHFVSPIDATDREFWRIVSGDPR